MAGLLELEVISPSRRVLQAQVEYVSVPGTEGRYGILPGHAPMLVALKSGVVHFRQAGERDRVAIDGGFLEVAGGQVTVLADAAELPGEIDVDRERAEAGMARQVLESSQDRTERAAARQRLERSLVRLQAAGVQEERR